MAKIDVVVSGDMVARRTIAGVLGFYETNGVSKRSTLASLRDAGLPDHAYDAPDFPISHAQHLQLSVALLRGLGREASSPTRLFCNLKQFDCGRFGLAGLSMQQAPSLADVLKVGIENPQLLWGHCRLSVLREGETLRIEFSMQKPVVPDASSAEIDALFAYGMTLDVLAVASVIAEVLSGRAPVDARLHPGPWPDRMQLPFAMPPDWPPPDSPLAGSVEFCAERGALHYPAKLLDAVPMKASRVSYLSHLRAAKSLAVSLTENASVADQVKRWLWASVPPMSRGEIAERLGCSERSLARMLRGEGRGYNALLAEVQTQRAMKLLEDPSLKVAAVAFRLGYSDPATFTRAFVSWTGLSPSAWRKSRTARRAVSDPADSV